MNRNLVRLHQSSFFILVSCLLAASCADKKDAYYPKLPIGALDAPTNGATVRGDTLVGGWALSEVGIKEISIYVDRVRVLGVKPSLSRPDVAKAYPDIPNNQNSGWNVGLTTGVYSPGPHTLTVQAVDNNGAVKELGSISIIVAKP